MDRVTILIQLMAEALPWKESEFHQEYTCHKQFRCRVLGYDVILTTGPGGPYMTPGWKWRVSHRDMEISNWALTVQDAKIASVTAIVEHMETR